MLANRPTWTKTSEGTLELHTENDGPTSRQVFHNVGPTRVNKIIKLRLAVARQAVRPTVIHWDTGKTSSTVDHGASHFWVAALSEDFYQSAPRRTWTARGDLSDSSWTTVDATEANLSEKQRGGGRSRLKVETGGACACGKAGHGPQPARSNPSHNGFITTDCFEWTQPQL